MSEVCIECGDPVDFDLPESEDLSIEFDLIEISYRSGEVEKVRMIFHKACNILRLEELAFEEEKQKEEETKAAWDSRILGL